MLYRIKRGYFFDHDRDVANLQEKAGDVYPDQAVEVCEWWKSNVIIQHHHITDHKSLPSFSRGSARRETIHQSHLSVSSATETEALTTNGIITLTDTWP